MDANQTSIFTAILITCIVLAVVLSYFIVVILRQHRAKNKLYKAKLLAEITTLENERARIANDLHDEIGPILSAVKLRANNIDISSEEDKTELDEINKNIDHLMTRMRSISNDLLPNTLKRKGLVAAIEEFINRTGVSNLQINFVHDSFSEIEKEKSVNLFRIVQEVTHNTIRHANAHVLNIELKSEKGKIILMTSDDGKGFDYDYLVKESTGLGLQSLLNRADVMGGDFYIESKPGKGTRYTFEIPIV